MTAEEHVALFSRCLSKAWPIYIILLRARCQGQHFPTVSPKAFLSNAESSCSYFSKEGKYKGIDYSFSVASSAVLLMLIFIHLCINYGLWKEIHCLCDIIKDALLVPVVSFSFSKCF